MNYDSSIIIEALGWTLLHSLWQAAALTAVLYFVLRVARRATPQFRYGAAGVTLVLILATAGVTLWRTSTTAAITAVPAATAIVPPPGHPVADATAASSPISVDPIAVPDSIPTATPNPSAAASGAQASRISRVRVATLLRPLLPWIVALWSLGVMILSIRVINGWRLTRRVLRLAAGPAQDSVIARFDRLAQRMRISRPVRLLSSVTTAVPMVIGWLKPVVLVPAALFGGLPAAQLEAILAHELAHIRRHDYLINLLQHVVETLFFFHPAVWWVSGQLRNEREHCCDDVASSLCGGALDYARALAALEETRDSEAILGMAATGGSLLDRVRRLIGATDDSASTPAWPIASVAFVVLVLVAPMIPLALVRASGQPPASTPAQKGEAAPKHEETAALLTLWREEYKNAPNVPIEAMRRLAAQVKEYIHRYPGAPAEKMKSLLPEFEKDRPWSWEQVRESIDALCDAATAPAGWFELNEQFRSFNRVKPGAAWTAEKLAALPFGPEAPNGLRAAWIFDPTKDSYSVGDVVKSRIIFHNNGKAPVEFRTDQWHQNDAWHVKNAAGDEVAVKTTWFTGVTPYQHFLLEPGQACEVAGHGAGIGAADYAEQYSIAAIGAEIAAKPGDELRCTWDVSLDPLWGKDATTSPSADTAPKSLATGEVKFKVTAADPNAAPKVGVARSTGKFDLAPGIKLQITQVTSSKDGEPTKRVNTATIEWYSVDKTLEHKWPIELRPGIEIDPVVWRRGMPRLWIVQPGVIRRIDFTNAADVKEDKWKSDDGGDFGDAPEEVKKEIEKGVPAISGRRSDEDLFNPAKSAPDFQDASLPIVYVAADGSISYSKSHDPGEDRTSIELANLPDRLRECNGRKGIVIKASSMASYSVVKDVLDSLGAAGFLRLGLATLKPLEFRLVSEKANDDTEDLPERKAPGKSGSVTILHVEKSAILTAADVKSVESKLFDGPDPDPRIMLELTDEGGAKLAKATKDNIGRSLAIVAEGVVLSAPGIRAEIGKTVMISGQFTSKELKSLTTSIMKAIPVRPEGTATGQGPTEIRKPGKYVISDRITATVSAKTEEGSLHNILEVHGIDHHGAVADDYLALRYGANSWALFISEPERRDGSCLISVLSRWGLAQFEFISDKQRAPSGNPGFDDDVRWQATAADLAANALPQSADAMIVKWAVRVLPELKDEDPAMCQPNLEVRLLSMGGETPEVMRISEPLVGERYRRTSRFVSLGERLLSRNDIDINGKIVEGVSDIVLKVKEEVKPAFKNACAKYAGRSGVILWNGKVSSLIELTPDMDTIFSGQVPALRQKLAHGHEEKHSPESKPARPVIANPDPFAVPADPQKAEEARKTGIRLNVFDSTGKRPLPEFRVTAGIRSSVSDEFEKAHGTGVVNWQPHTLHIGRDGGLVWPLDKAYDEMALRVEADGHVPQVAWVKKFQGPQDLFFHLIPSEGTAGRVFTPDGSPAAGATVALAMVQRDAVIEGGKLRHVDEELPGNPADRWRWPVFLTADANGRFQLPAESDPTAAVLITHESGVREMSLADFKMASDVTLQKWGRIEGKIQWGEKPGGILNVSLTIFRDDYGYPGVISQYEKTKSAGDGSFVFERVLPGAAQLSCAVEVSPAGDQSSFTEFGKVDFHLSGQIAHLTVQPGVTPAVIGGKGRTVKGRLTGRQSWDGVTFHFHPIAPHIGFPGDNATWKAWDGFRKSAIGPLFFREGLKVNADGTFEIPEVLPGHYQIFFSSGDAKDPVATGGQFDVGSETANQKPGDLEIGEFKAKPQP